MESTAEAPHDVLGVALIADEADVRRAYQELARQVHPDRPGGCAKAFQRIQAAYDALIESDEARRKLAAKARAAQMAIAPDVARVLEVDLGEMRYEEEAPTGSGVWRCECRCGDEFVLREVQLVAGIDTLHCRSCSLVLRPLYQRVDDGGGVEDDACDHSRNAGGIEAIHAACAAAGT